MSPQSLGNILIVANPAAHSGRGEAAAIYVTRYFSSSLSAASSCSVWLTEHEGDAVRMAADAAEYDTVIALGGDGVTHEVVNGLMTIPESDRPRLGVIPVGSGNDFARTLGMTKNKPERALAEVLGGEERDLDLGRVNDRYFMETLSFGVDAAIAHDTTKRREAHGYRSGSGMYLTSGIRLMAGGLKGWPYRANIDGRALEGIDVAFAVQNGKTYGGGFRICPDAVPNDGFLDLCLTVEKPNHIHSMYLFGLIRFGRHKRSRKLHMQKVRHLEVEFVGDEQPPCQIDGEVYEAKRYVIDVVPAALRVIAPSNCSW